jgi:hypothetical protein
MDKRFQVFVSSTYADLKEERQKVLQTLMEMDCIPSGMEMFPASDEEQWEFIKKVIDDCDYYLLIIGGRYGSISDDGISYTEKEYKYAVEKGIKVIAFLHEKPEEIAVSKSDVDPDLVEKLKIFRDKVATGRLVKFWNSAAELPGLVALSLTKTIKAHPAIGWVRANNLSSAEILQEVNELRKDNQNLRIQLQKCSTNEPVAIADLAELSSTIKLFGTYKLQYGGQDRSWDTTMSWEEIFGVISPYLLENPGDTSVLITLKKNAIGKVKGSYHEAKLDDQVYQTIKIQLMALGLVTIDYLKTVKGGMALFWQLTEKGKILMMQLRTIKKSA